MIKGINHQIIEVTETDNIFYERALLVIRPEYTGAQKAVLEKEAKKMLRDMGAPSFMKKQHKYLYWAIRLIPAALLGALTAWVILTLL